MKLKAALLLALLLRSSALMAQERALSLQAFSFGAGIVSAGAPGAFALSGGVELAPRRGAGALRLELSGWRSDRIEQGQISRADHSASLSYTRRFFTSTRPVAVVPVVNGGIALHQLTFEQPDATRQPTWHLGAFAEAGTDTRLTRSDLLALELRGRVAAVSANTRQLSIRIGLRVQPGTTGARSSTVAVPVAQKPAPPTDTARQSRPLKDADLIDAGTHKSEALPEFKILNVVRYGKGLLIRIPAASFDTITHTLQPDAAREFRKLVKVLGERAANVEIIASPIANESTRLSSIRAASVARVVSRLVPPNHMRLQVSEAALPGMVIVSITR